ncbi:DoxX family protein [Pseudochrobactrum kiredjianiae]|uniref:DoxX family protein n=1 Tax=Pseudochrobactrum kiredjianiae TaxID=386305 RepID=A0ABW3V7C8_9HYPH|nr:DoxX family protein [Pseudochrobactrum kiredjianiae]MDM7849927.1 DoxX family protein [Pseudochrobactrum kiredjianiae]
MNPNWIYQLLAMPVIQLLARILLTITFWLSGLAKLFDFPAAVAEMTANGLPAPALFAALTIAVQLIGSALVIWGGSLVWLGAGALGVFTAATIPVSHAFWRAEGAEAIAKMHVAVEHLSVIGGLIVVAVLHAVVPHLRRK